MNAKLLPCGHIGECVIGTFYVCKTSGCDGTAPATDNQDHNDFGDEDLTPPETLSDMLDCPRCSSGNTEPFSGIVPGQWHCWDCGTVFHP